MCKGVNTPLRFKVSIAIVILDDSSDMLLSFLFIGR